MKKRRLIIGKIITPYDEIKEGYIIVNGEQIEKIGHSYKIKGFKNNEIIEYLKILANILKPLSPVLFYISQSSVKESLKHTAVIRSKPKWATEETIAYYEKRKALELEAIEKFTFKSIITTGIKCLIISYKLSVWKEIWKVNSTLEI
jgi:hypothetical protein